MYRLYCVLKDRNESPTPDEIAIASGNKVADPDLQAEWLKKLENTSDNIQKAFAAQEAQAAVCFRPDSQLVSNILALYRVHGIKKNLKSC
jgi:hypothetical protein